MTLTTVLSRIQLLDEVVLPIVKEQDIKRVRQST